MENTFNTSDLPEHPILYVVTTNYIGRQVKYSQSLFYNAEKENDTREKRLKNCREVWMQNKEG